eukprot:2369019-Pyramimonas_sp.AAC.1
MLLMLLLLIVGLLAAVLLLMLIIIGMRAATALVDRHCVGGIIDETGRARADRIGPGAGGGSGAVRRREAGGSAGCGNSTFARPASSVPERARCRPPR